VSRVGDREETLISPELQAERIQGYAAARGLSVEMLDPELDVSGARTSRPILDRAIDDIAEGRYAGLIVAQLDRLSRMAVVDALKIIERIEGYGGQVISVAENFDAGTPEGNLSRTLMLSIGAMQRDRYSAQFSDAKKQALERGLLVGSQVPFGYQVKRVRDGGDGKLKPDKAAAKLVRKAFELRAAGGSWVDVGTVIGKSPNGARSVVRNRVYLGELHLKPFTPNLEAHEAIIEVDLWNAAQQAKGTRPARNPDSQPVLLAGLVRCAGCQRLMSVYRGQRAYKCKRYHAHQHCTDAAWVSQPQIEALVEDSVLAYLRDRLHIETTQQRDELAALEARLTEAETELAAFIEGTQASGVAAEVFASGLRQRSDAVETARRDLQAARGPELPVFSGGIDDVWPSLTVIERRQVIVGTIGSVWVKRGRGVPLETRVKLSTPDEDVPGQGHKAAPAAPIDWVTIRSDVDLQA
jgi:DNA invertase Pin-like site-specific DNA recombinase